MLERVVLPQNRSALDDLFFGDSAPSSPQSQSFDRNAPFRLQLECSAQCSADCIYCYTGAIKGGEPLTTREIKGLLRRAAGLGIRQVDWMGGDPLERPDWEELMYAARYNGLTNNLWTCGPRLDDVVVAKKVTELTRGGFVSIHLDSLDPEVLKALRNSYNPRAIHDTLKGLEMLLDVGKPPEEVSNLVMLTSYHTVEDVRATMGTLLRDYRVRTVLMSLKPVDDRGTLYPFLPRADDVNQAYRARDDMFLRGRGMGCQDFPKQYCGTCVFISLDGKVSSCYSLRRSLGNVREHTFEDIVAANTSSLFFTPYRSSDHGASCSMCDQTACWGCRANAFYFGRGVYAEDPLCGHSHKSTGSDIPY